ncbi:MAG: Spi family protease inhibitor, partial [Muribaculaceae bacterium]|nr:Spi family protease inhibitor [Muribaculaceae bacterium]
MAILFLFSDCSQQIEFETNGEEIVLSDTFVTLSEALKKAEPFFASIENTATRSDDRKVKSIEYISQPNTRSTEKVLYYLVNFSDNKGFAILSSDNRLLPVY